MKGDAKTYLKYRKNIEGSMTNGFLVFYKNTPESIAAGKVRLGLNRSFRLRSY